MGGFVRKLVWGLIFEIWARSHGGDLVEDTISTSLITPIDPETDPKMAGMLVQDDTGWFGGGLGADLGNYKGGNDFLGEIYLVGGVPGTKTHVFTKF